MSLVEVLQSGNYHLIDVREPMELEMNGHIVEARVSGKMRQNLIRIFPGDTVLLEIPICDLTRGRIIYRK